MKGSPQPKEKIACLLTHTRLKCFPVKGNRSVWIDLTECVRAYTGLAILKNANILGNVLENRVKRQKPTKWSSLDEMSSLIQ